MLVTPAGMVMEVREVAPENAQSPMFVTLAGMVMEVREVAEANAAYPMLVTPSGIVIEVSPLEEKAYGPMLVSWLPAAKLMEASAFA